MEDIEKELDSLEQQIPILSGSVVLSAYASAMAAGHRVLESRNGEIREVSAPGSPKIKDIEPAFHIGQGKKFKIR